MKDFHSGTEGLICQKNCEGWKVGVWEGFNLGSIPNDHIPSQKDPKISIERRCSTILPEVLSLTALFYCVSGYNSSWCVRQVAPYGFMQNQGRALRTEEQFLLLICSPLRKSSSSRFNSRPSGQFTPLPLLSVSLTIAHYFGKQD